MCACVCSLLSVPRMERATTSHLVAVSRPCGGSCLHRQNSRYGKRASPRAPSVHPVRPHTRPSVPLPVGRSVHPHASTRHRMLGPRAAGVITVNTQRRRTSPLYRSDTVTGSRTAAERVHCSLVALRAREMRARRRCRRRQRLARWVRACHPPRLSCELEHLLGSAGVRSGRPMAATSDRGSHGPQSSQCRSRRRRSCQRRRLRAHARRPRRA